MRRGDEPGDEASDAARGAGTAWGAGAVPERCRRSVRCARVGRGRAFSPRKHMHRSLRPLPSLLLPALLPADMGYPAV